MPTLHIFRGLPGSGKSTAARKLAAETGAILIEPDALLVQDGVYWYTPERYSMACIYAKTMIENAKHVGADAIYADVLPTRESVEGVLFRLRDSDNYRVVVHDLKITPEESKLRNRHNVRPEDIDRMAQEWEDWE